MKKNLFLKLFLIFFLVCPTIVSANCMWATNDKCQDIGATNNWAQATKETFCDAKIKPTGYGTTKCCCASSNIYGCCEKTANNIITATDLTGEDCKKITYANTIFYQDKVAANNICVNKTIAGCSWKIRKISNGGPSGSKVTGGCLSDEAVSDIKKCNSTPPELSSMEQSVCCCSTPTATIISTPPKFVMPELQISIPGLTLTPSSSIKYTSNSDGSYYVEIPWLSEYLSAIYNYGLSIAGILAAIVLMGGGLFWLISGGDTSKITQAKELIIGSVTGIIILFSSYIILIQINPNLVKFKPITIGTLANKSFESSLENWAASGFKTKSYDIQCLEQKYVIVSVQNGNYKCAQVKPFETVTFKNKNFSLTPEAATAFRKAISETPQTALDKITLSSGDGSFNCRANVNSKVGAPSPHAYGIAVDIMSGETDNRNNATRKKDGACPTATPQEFISAMKNNGFRWGGNYSSVCDSMHFEYMRGCPQ